MTHTDTIAAIATATGAAAIGIARVSGADALDITARVFFPSRGALADREPGKLIRGTARDADGNVLDDCAAIIFGGTGGYTGEPSAEIHCHGSPVVLAAVLRALLAAGARMAKPGEFTKRAFLNGKMDLTRAEAVADLIGAETEAAAKNAANQLLGAMSRKTRDVYSALLDITAHFHAVIDYPDEDIDEFDVLRHASALDGAGDTLGALAATFERGRVMVGGVPAAIVGRPNVGKSSLLNALLGYDRAIVTAQAGTTRDTIEEKLVIRGMLLRLTDTAGIRGAEDEAERLGILRAKDAAGASSIVLAVFDGSTPVSDDDRAAVAALPERAKKIAVINKSDLARHTGFTPPGAFDAEVSVSAKTGAGLDALIDALAALLPSVPAPTGEILTNERQFDAVTRAQKSVCECAAALRAGITPDAALTELEAALSALGELEGRNLREDTVERIFERFCVGK